MVASELASDLQLLRRAIDEIREQTLAETIALAEPTAVDLASALRTHRNSYERAVAPMQLEWEVPAGAVAARVAGGEVAFRRAILNLLINAREGNDVAHATSARIALIHRDESLQVVVLDDGPGLPADTGEGSSKLFGTGMGLRFVRTVARASGGAFELANANLGARATLTLPALAAPVRSI